MIGGFWQIETGRLTVANTPEKFPFGERGVRPLSFQLTDEGARARVLQERIPGVQVYGKKVSCAWDCATTLSKILGGEQLIADLYAARDVYKIPMPGLARYKELGLDKRRHDYQADAAIYLLRRAGAIIGDCPRAGKTISSIITLLLAGCSRTLVIAPAIAKLVWAEEIVKWLRLPSAMLYGRSGDEFRAFCVPCVGLGYTVVDGSRKRCTFCRARNGQSLGETIHLSKSNRAEFIAKLRRYPFIICNYDILAPQKEVDLVGGESYREDMMGWGPVLAELEFDSALIDEFHNCRTYKKSSEIGTPHRSELVYSVCENIERVYGLTGTPIYGFVKDLWGQLNIVTKGLWS